MSRHQVSILLTLIFVGFLTAPTIIRLVDDSADVSIFYTSPSPEEDQGIEKNNHVEVLFTSILKSDLDFSSIENENNLEFCFRNYPKPHLNLISPPPDLNL